MYEMNGEHNSNNSLYMKGSGWKQWLHGAELSTVTWIQELRKAQEHTFSFIQYTDSCHMYVIMFTKVKHYMLSYKVMLSVAYNAK